MPKLPATRWTRRCQRSSSTASRRPARSPGKYRSCRSPGPWPWSLSTSVHGPEVVGRVAVQARGRPDSCRRSLSPRPSRGRCCWCSAPACTGRRRSPSSNSGSRWHRGRRHAESGRRGRVCLPLAGTIPALGLTLGSGRFSRRLLRRSAVGAYATISIAGKRDAYAAVNSLKVGLIQLSSAHLDLRRQGRNETACRKSRDSERSCP